MLGMQYYVTRFIWACKWSLSYEDIGRCARLCEVVVVCASLWRRCHHGPCCTARQELIIDLSVACAIRHTTLTVFIGEPLIAKWFSCSLSSPSGWILVIAYGVWKWTAFELFPIWQFGIWNLCSKFMPFLNSGLLSKSPMITDSFVSFCSLLSPLKWPVSKAHSYRIQLPRWHAKCPKWNNRKYHLGVEVSWWRWCKPEIATQPPLRKRSLMALLPGHRRRMERMKIVSPSERVDHLLQWNNGMLMACCGLIRGEEVVVVIVVNMAICSIIYASVGRPILPVFRSRWWVYLGRSTKRSWSDIQLRCCQLHWML